MVIKSFITTLQAGKPRSWDSIPDSDFCIFIASEKIASFKQPPLTRLSGALSSWLIRSGRESDHPLNFQKKLRIRDFVVLLHVSSKHGVDTSTGVTLLIT